jgi:alkylation response protein AidB-like acyl-CoA dehydrogenase
MDFNLTQEQRDIQKAAQEFAKGEFDPDQILEYDRNQEFPQALFKKAGNLGFLGVHFPEALGGQGLGILDHALIVEAFCRRDSGVGAALAFSDFGSEFILDWGSEDQKERVLPSVAAGKNVLTAALLEDGYALAPLKTKALKAGEGYRINGKKSFVPLGDLAPYMIVLCQADDQDPRAQSAFLLEKETRGVGLTPMGEKVGLRMIPLSAVVLTEVEVPRESRIGLENSAQGALSAFLDKVRIEAGAVGVGIAQGALDFALDYSKKREQFRRAIVSFDAVRNKLANMCVDLEMARLMVYKAAWTVDCGKPDRRSILMSKAVGTSAALRAANDALQIHGGYGYMTEAQIEHFYRDSKALSLFLESTQTQKDLLVDDMAGRR